MKYPSVHQWQTIAPQQHLAESWNQMVHDKNLRSCNLWPIKKLDRSIGLLDLDFIFLFRVIDFKSGDKNDGSDGTLSRVMVRHSVPARLHLHNKCSLYSSSVKWSPPVHFLKAQGNFFCHFLVPFFTYFWHLKITNRGFKTFPGWLHFTLLSFFQYLDNCLGQLTLSIF